MTLVTSGMRRTGKICSFLFVAAVCALWFPAAATAETGLEASRYPWYSNSLSYGCQPNTTNDDESGEEAVVDYAGNPILTEGQLSQIYENQTVYEEAAKEAGIPWQMLAAIHKMESGLKKENPANGQGVYQFVNGDAGSYPAGPVSDEEFLRQSKIAAQFIKSKVSSNYPANRNLSSSGTNVEAVKDTFFSYNGRADAYITQAQQLGFDPATQGYEGSPYVMNRADSRRDPSVNQTTWGQIKQDGGSLEYPANSGHGAFVIYGAIAGIGTNCGVLANGTLLWPMTTTIGVTSCFGPRVLAGKTELHEGLDMDGGDGAPILAASGGLVVFAGSAPGYGPNYVVVQHNGFATGYGHMQRMSVKKGDTVTQGQPIGAQGNEGRSFGSHLHFNVIPGDYSKKQANVNPLQNGLIIPDGVANTYGCH